MRDYTQIGSNGKLNERELRDLLKAQLDEIAHLPPDVTRILKNVENTIQSIRRLQGDADRARGGRVRL